MRLAPAVLLLSSLPRPTSQFLLRPSISRPITTTSPTLISADDLNKFDSWADAVAHYKKDSISFSKSSKRLPSTRSRRSSPAIPPIPPTLAGRECYNSCITPGLSVIITKKEHQRTGQETAAIVQRLLTKVKYHPRGIKVMCKSGVVGRVKRIVADDHE